MAKLNTFEKEHFLFVGEVLVLLALFGILLLIDFAIYLKLISAFLFIFILVGWFLLGFSKLKQRSRLLIEARKQDTQKLSKLSEFAAELARIPIIRNKLPEITSRLAEIFAEYYESDKFVLFVKKRNLYQTVLAHNVSLPQKGRIRIKSNSEFISKVKSKEELRDFEFTQSTALPDSLRSLQKQLQANRLIPLATESDLWGFVMLSEGKNQPAGTESKAGPKNPAEGWDDNELVQDKRLPLLVLNQIALSLEKEDLANRLEEVEKKVKADTRQDKAEISILNRDLKRRIFDLNAVLELAKNLYSILEEEGLFSLLARMMQDHLGAKSVFLMFPDKETGDVVGKYFYGVQVSDLFGKESLSELRMEKEKALYNWIKNEKQIWQLYTMQKLSREDRFLKALLASGFHIGAKLTFSADRFGIIFLGEKTDGAKYRQTDLEILAILINMAVITYKNIRHFKSIEELSYTDSITGLYNYRYFYKRLTEEVFRAKRFSRKLALVIFDIDDFKIYNDTYGHQAGDQLLKQLGELLTSTVRSIDVVSRYGGEEFCVIMPESDQEECLKFMERLRKNIMNFPFKDEHSNHEHNITVSLGGAIYPHVARSVDRVIYCADMGLLKAKSTGKNRSVMYQEELVPVSQ